MRGEPWTPKQLRALKKHYPHKKTALLVPIIGRTIDSIYSKASELNLHKTAEFYASDQSSRITGGEAGIKHRFKKGHQTWNKGKKGLNPNNHESRFKHGNRPHNHHPVGSTKIRKDGYHFTKVGEPNEWRLTHHIIWEQAGNPPPVHPEVLRFKDRNKPGPPTIDNLEISNKATMMDENSVQRLPEELKKTIQLLGVLRRKTNGK
ncbi:hypothetical protein [Candidatus Nitrotoga sp. M5]|uniref:hypothetical protein n=1 Tax=Candidatus Nitrotoga sp. M5 TaxID=2890409 RepID=UPI001EF42425|nr:hypothetical protein [Candidatus Nitrotoga sp. M5]CAH1387061.1 HNH endonuclease [Candidatus Nitrotoga sp. M5]